MTVPGAGAGSDPCSTGGVRSKRRFPTHIRPDDRPEAGWVIDPSRFRRFDQVDDVFNRSWWDEEIRSKATERFFMSYRRPLEEWRRARGFRRKDYALRNAAWHGADIFAELKENEDRREGFLDPLTVLRQASDERTETEDPAQAATELKQVARVLGADLVGVTGTDERWLYSHRYSRMADGPKPNPMDPALEHVVVVGQAMDRSLIATAPSALAGAATGIGYSQDVVVLLAISQYIRNLGYQAVPTLNDTALAIPYAVKAGLGEYGRNGLVITPEYGPNVRFGKIFTDLPLAHDGPVRFGVEEMCGICRACTEACPSGAIPAGEPTDRRHNRSNIAGITKWTVDGEACFSYWAKINSDCSVCIRVCPYTRDHGSWPDRLWMRLASGRFRRLALWWDRHSSRGRRVSSVDWWPDGGSTVPVRIGSSPPIVDRSPRNDSSSAEQQEPTATRLDG
ncbi:MAG TPA: 4Fe-4S dicluster domain-containing protein [Acidimicrobiales bacterium]|nr:4Fe-4S dicluster domain-containing protein [Acidimicrobiales bacterium]